MKTKPKSKSLKLIAEEIPPKLRLLMDELLETLDVMGSKEELEAIKESLEQVRRDETRDWVKAHTRTLALSLPT